MMTGVTADSSADIFASVDVLSKLSTVSSETNTKFGGDVVNTFLSTASNLTDNSRTAAWDPKRKTSGAITLLNAIESFVKMLEPSNASFVIETPNILLQGCFFNSTLDKNYTKSFKARLGVSMMINYTDIQHMVENVTNITVSSTVYISLSDLIDVTGNAFQGYFLNSLIQSTSISTGSSITPTGIGISMTFENDNKTQSTDNAVCVFWDKNASSGTSRTGDWSSYGCQTIVTGNVTTCRCNHLTSFAVLMAMTVLQDLLIVSQITQIGLGVSIGALCICLFIEKIVWNSVVKSNISHFRHTALINIAFSLLAADICFVASDFPLVKKWGLLCSGITFLSHFFYLALFFWTLCQSLMLFHQLTFVFHQLRKKMYMTVSFGVGFGCPFLIAMGTFFYYFPRGTYRNDRVCWLKPTGGPIYAFIIPAGTIVIVNFLIMIVVIAKLMRPSVSDGSKAEDKETAKNILKAVLILTPVFGLTWALGFATMQPATKDVSTVFNYAFSIMNAFQGLFILITSCATEKKVRETFLKKIFNIEPKSSSTSTKSEFTSKAAPS
ncbi:adhesion G-protein coupled receptor F3-like [Protopterus annectens]|uniref:adhesion G-protein coupled receptor F3-like n=1 Tax=Protopterus annectens TaxID=7888 RepID=UPI001CF9D6EF|nr:adhesion G-protein coupled receptor F3-like [Protopterus annectens]